MLTGFGLEEPYVDELLLHFEARHGGAREFALKQRVLLLRTAQGVPVDVALAGLPLEERVIERSSMWHLDDAHELRTCSAEDLVVYKAFAGRGIDWFDIDGVLMRQGTKLDTKLIIRELTPLAELKEQLEIVDELRKRIEQQLPERH